jgi:DNA-nicking Smr family endonuclease
MKKPPYEQDPLDPFWEALKGETIPLQGQDRVSILDTGGCLNTGRRVPKTFISDTSVKNQSNVKDYFTTSPLQNDPLKNFQKTPVQMLSSKERKKMAKALERSIDLHGYTQEQAFHILVRVLERYYEDGLKNIRVITGKGGSKGVLRHKVPHWFGAHPLNQWVHSYITAQDRDGGAGALYVRLKSLKKTFKEK